jgi:hypothetical protein
MSRTALLAMLSVDSYLQQPSLIPVHMDSFQKWKVDYIHEYRKAHRAHHEALFKVESSLERLRPLIRALNKMNSIVELGPPLAASIHAGADLLKIEASLCSCADSTEAAVDQTSPICRKCKWTPNYSLPEEEVNLVRARVDAGFADRFQRFKDATIAAILQKAAETKGTGLEELINTIQIGDADKLANVLTDDLVLYLRKLLYDENLVSEEVALEPIIQQVGAIEEDRLEEAISLINKLLIKAVKEAKEKHDGNKRVRVFLRFQAADGGQANVGD